MARMTVRILGVIFIVLGVVGFFQSFDSIFSLTVNHDVVHLLSGVVLIALSGTEALSKLGSKIVGFIYLLVFIAGLFTHSIAGIMLMPMDNVLHLIIAAVLLFVGFKTTTAVRSSNTSSIER
jgi:uncharacterized membrane protein HdeD (DUF308 family)